MFDEFNLYASQVVYFLFILTLGWYLILNLQWYSYRLERVLLNHKKHSWHLLHFAIPIIAFYLTGPFFVIYFVFGQLPLFILWYRKRDKPLILTSRVKRFFGFLISLTLITQILCFEGCAHQAVLAPLIGAWLLSSLTERLFANYYRGNAKAKLLSNPELKIVAITASYGKTSIKNILFHLTSGKFNAYMTPRSINTEMGLIADINQKLPKDCNLYIAEAGARQSGDILKIGRLLQHQYAILGNVGPQHIEYFKTLENVKRTKREIFMSNRLIKAVVHESAEIAKEEMLVFGTHAPYRIENIDATLEHTAWDLITPNDRYRLHAPLLGAFNANNISAAFLMGLELGIEAEYLMRRIKTLSPIKHRLERIEASGKLIIDDSFNGNLEGMLEGVRLAKRYEGRKVIVTPGIVESDEASNITFAKAVNEVFDCVIVTSDLNEQTFATHVETGKRRRVFSKPALEKMLEHETQMGDLILFANDAPNFV